MSGKLLLRCIVFLPLLVSASASAQTGQQDPPQCFNDSGDGVFGAIDLVAGLVRTFSPFSHCSNTEPNPGPVPERVATAPRVVADNAVRPVVRPDPRRMELPPTQKFVIKFRPRSAALDGDAQAVVAHVVSAVGVMGPVHVTAVGYPDPAGPGPQNPHIALQRAQAVRAALIRSGFNPANVTATAAPGNTVPADPWRVALAVGD